MKRTNAQNNATVTGKELKMQAKLAEWKYGHLNDDQILKFYKHTFGVEVDDVNIAKVELMKSRETRHKLEKFNMAEFEKEMKVNEPRVNLIMSLYAEVAHWHVTPEDYPQAKEFFDDIMTARDTCSEYMSKKSTVVLTDEEVKIFINLFEATTGYAENIGATATIDERVSYMLRLAQEFERKWFSESIKKSCRQQLKMTLGDIDPISLTFDSSKANGSGTIFWISTAEDELYRIIQKYGKEMVTINMAEGDVEFKHNIFLNGVTDVATGKTYFFVWQGPSATRKADATFVSGEKFATADESFSHNVLPLWLEATGLTEERLFATFMKEGKFVLNKLNARLAVNSSDTFKLQEIAPEWAEHIRNWKVVYGVDPVIRVSRPNKHLVDGKLVMDTSGHEVTPGDGQCIASLLCKADLNASVRTISTNEALIYKMIVNRATNIADSEGHDAAVRFLMRNKEFNRINRKMSDFFQVRKEASIEKGGITFVYPWFMPTTEDGTRYDIFVAESFVKCQGVKWDESNLMVCGFLHDKKKYVVLGNQFIQALDSSNPQLLKPVIDYWFSVITEAMEQSDEGIAKAMAFHGIIGEDNDNDSLVKSAIIANPELLNDFYISDLRGKQIDKLIHEMLSGRIRVPGTYTYQACDPAAVLNMVFGLDNPTLASGEQYFNGLSCKAGIFRSPKVAQCQAQKVQLVSTDLYFYTNDLFIHNAIDGVWDRLAGSDFDGDQIAVVPDNTTHGALVVSAIKEFDYDICEPKAEAVKSEWSWENYCRLMAENISPDETGSITNNNSHFWELYNHLVGFVNLYRAKGFESVIFVDPTNENHNRHLPIYDEMGEKHDPDVYTEMLARYPWVCDGKLYAPGIRQQVWDALKNQYVFKENDYDLVGEMTMKQVLEKAEMFFNLGEITAAFQGIEIDGAKTFVYARDMGYGDSYQCNLVTGQMLCRKKFLGRVISGKDWRNTYASCSMLGYINVYTQQKEREFRAIEEQKKTNFVARAYSLLSQEERADLQRNISLQDGSVMTLLDYVRARKEAYNNAIRNASTIIDEEARANFFASLREAEVQVLLSIVGLGFSVEAVAVACYLAAYNGSSMSRGLSYGWMLSDDLLAVFSRGGKRTQLVRVPRTTMFAEVNGSVLYVNDRKYRAIDACNGEATLVDINGYKYAKVSMRTTTADVQSMEMLASGSRFEGISLVGFAFNDFTIADFKEAVHNSGNLSIRLNSEGRLMLRVDDVVFAEVKGKDSFKLNGHSVKLMKSASYKETEKSLNGLVIYVK